MTRASLAALALVLSGCMNTGDYELVPCASNADCIGRSSCRTVTWRDGSGGLCTAGCTGESSCPHDGRCLDVNMSGEALCFEPCSLDPDCPTGFICQPVTTGGSVCLPSG